LDFDEDSFVYFRESDVVKEVAEECYRALRSQYFMRLRQQGENCPPDQWQVVRKRRGMRRRKRRRSVVVLP